MPRLSAGLSASAASLPGAGGDRLREARPGSQIVDQPPLKGSAAPDAFGGGAQEVGVIAAHLAFVHQPGQTAGAGEDGQQGKLRQRHRAGAVVDEDDVLAGQGQLVSSPRRRAVDRADIGLAGVGGGVFDGVPGLVGELAEVDLVGVSRLGQHPDVGPGAEDPLLSGGDHDGPDLRMLEPKPLHRVVKLDVHAQVVGVLLQLIPRRQPGILPHGERQPGHPSLDRQRPVPVPVGVRREVYRGNCGRPY